MRDVIVTDGFWRKSLSAVRSLGRSGYRVIVLGDSIFTTSFWSRFASVRFFCASAKDDPDKFGRQLLAILQKRVTKSHCKVILLPMEDESLNWISENRDSVSELADILLPPVESLRIAQNKASTQAFASHASIPVPETISPGSLDGFIAELKILKEKSIENNYIVKPATGSGSSGIIYLEDKNEINWNEHWAKHGNLLIQERIPAEGQGIGVSLIFNAASECIASFVHKRIQQYPNSGGPSTSRVSAANDHLTDLSIKMLKMLAWQGVAMVEWKMDIRNNIPKLMEINPRFWGSLELATRSGVDFPDIYARLSAGQNVEKISEYETGVICRWMFPGEILRYITQNRSKREKLSIFLKGLPYTAEEWSNDDYRGFVAAFLCPVFSVLNPKYWKYLKR